MSVWIFVQSYIIFIQTKKNRQNQIQKEKHGNENSINQNESNNAINV